MNLNNPIPVAPYTNWNTAATNIQTAVDIAVSSDLVLVTNGVYETGSRIISGVSRVAVDSKVITIQSVNGPAVTVIKGFQMPGTTNGTDAIRCVYLASGARLFGFTLTNGAAAPYATTSGGGIYCQSTSCLVSNCVITGNVAYSGGGAYSGTFVNCFFIGNSAFQSVSLGGGAYGSLLTNCVFYRNQAVNQGGAAHNCTMVNCTIVSNTAPNAVNDCSLKNCIVYYNYTSSGTSVSGGTYFTNCCASSLSIQNGNSFTTPPLFANLAAADFHLQTGSPCVNAGNNAFVAVATDLDGNPRIQGGTVDIGAYESPQIRYVSLSNSVPVPPYTNWAAAATNIQDAIDVANPGDLVLVSNGVYGAGGRAVYGSSTNRVVVDKPVAVRSVNGPAVTSIAGARSIVNVRCVYLTNGASLNGFTLTNGSSLSSGDLTNEQSGGAVWCASASATISNCVFVNNYANQNGGGTYQGTLSNCILSNNVAFIAGGGAFAATLNDCLVSSNRVVQGSGGGGVWGGALNNCTVKSNNAFSGGGAYQATLNNCIVVSNFSSSGGGGYACTFQNCIIAGNTGTKGGGMNGGVANNCLIVSNSTPSSGGGVYAGGNSLVLSNCTLVGNTAGSGGGAYGGTFYNCIIYFNSASSGPDALVADLFYCCTPGATGNSNIPNDPGLLDVTGGDYHLRTNSPCINSGRNVFAPVSPDLEGNPRISGGTVDIGAYELQSPASIISYAWLLKYGLATDGSADGVDSDGDGMTNWQEWRSQTDPTNALSFLKMDSVNPGTAGSVVTWQAVNGVSYFLQRSSDFITQPFFTIQSNLAGVSGPMSYTDTNVIGAGPFFYRIGVQ